MRKFLMVLAVCVGAVAAALPALAADGRGTKALGGAGRKDKPASAVHHHGFAGSVSSVGSSSVTVNVLLTGKHDTELNGQTVTVSVTADSELVSGKDKTPIALGEIKAGDLVGIHVT